MSRRTVALLALLYLIGTVLLVWHVMSSGETSCSTIYPC